MVVADPVARDLDRLACVVAVAQRHDAGIEGGGEGEGLEGRAHFVDAERRPVEARVGVGLARQVGVEVGQADHRQHFAGLHVEHQPGGAQRLELGDRRRELFVQHMLDPQVDGQRQRLALLRRFAREPGIERELETRKTAVVDSRVAQRVGEQGAVGIDPALVAFEGEAGQAQPVDLVLLARRQVTLDPDEAAIRGQLGEQRVVAELGQHRGKARGRLLGIEHQRGIGVERGRGQVGRDQHAVAVDDVGARAGIPRRVVPVVGQGPVIAAKQGDLDELAADDGTGQGEQRAGHDESESAGLDRLLAGALELDAQERTRRDPAQIVLAAAAKATEPFHWLTVRTGRSGASAGVGASLPSRRGRASRLMSCEPSIGRRSRWRAASVCSRWGRLR